MEGGWVEVYRVSVWKLALSLGLVMFSDISVEHELHWSCVVSLRVL